MGDFDHFFDSVLLRADTTKTGERARMVVINDVCREIDPNVSPDWVRHTIKRLEDLKYGRTIRDATQPGRVSFAINGRGLLRVAEIKRARRPPSVSDRLASDKFQKISTLSLSALSFVVSIAALIVAYLAYQKA
jgi:hypothetical protein